MQHPQIHVVFQYEENEQFPQVFPKVYFKKHTEYFIDSGLIGCVRPGNSALIHAFYKAHNHRKRF